MKKLVSLIILITIVFVFFLFFYLTPKNYEVSYTVDDYDILEKYDKENKYYFFEIKNDDYEFNYISEAKYSAKRMVVKSIETISETGMNCIILNLKQESSYPLCYDKGEALSYSLIENNTLTEKYYVGLNTVSDSYKNVNIYNYLNQNYLLWNYKGFYFINEDTKKEISLFNKDVYNINLVATVNNYLIIPNYDMEYTFNEMYIINLKNGDKSIWKLDTDISFDSYIIGSYKKSIYLFDKKNNTQYELVPSKKKMRKLNKNNMGKFYDNELIDITINELASNNPTFKYFEKYNYFINNEELYLKSASGNINIRISNLVNPKIIYQKNESVYYLKDGKLYAFNPKFGEVLLMQNFEWNFNSDNMIIVYKP